MPRVSGRWCEVTVKEETPGPMPLVWRAGSALGVWGEGWRGGAASALLLLGSGERLGRCP